MPVVPIVHPQEYIKMAIYKIKSMKPAMKSFWYTYNRTMGFEDFTSILAFVIEVTISLILYQDCIVI